jgi:large subunit ribosomal protein L4
MTSVAATEPRTASVRKRERPEPAKRQVERKAADGVVLGTVDLDPQWFGLEVNTSLMHQVVVAQLAAARSGTQSTKTRAEVAGGGAKPFRQKGMGRSRQGSIRAPHWVGGGVAFGPKPRSYKQRTPKKMIRQALLCALSDRASLGRVALVNEWPFDLPRTKQAVGILKAFGLTGRVLVVVGPDDVVAERSFGNLPRVQILQVSELNTYDVLRNDWVLFTDESIPGGVGDVSSHVRHEIAEPVVAEPAKKAPIPKAKATEAVATTDAPDDETEDSTGDEKTTGEVTAADAVSDDDAAGSDEPAGQDDASDVSDSADDDTDGDDTADREDEDKS